MNAQTKTANPPTAKIAGPTSEPEANAVVVRHPAESPIRNALAIQAAALPPTITDRPVLQAISRIMREVGAVEKDGYNEFHRYKYASAAAIAHALQKLMAENGLVIVQRERDTRYDDAMGMLAIRYDFDILHASGDYLDPVQHTGISAAKNSKGGFDDKAANKCHTAARKYFLLGLFQIPTGDYPDADAAEDVPAEKAKKETPAQQAKAQPKQSEQKAPEKKEHRPFALIDGDGNEHTFAKGGDYLAGIEQAFQEAADKLGFWDSNVGHFQGWQAKLMKVGTDPKAIAEFSRVSKEITDTVFILNSQKGA